MNDSAPVVVDASEKLNTLMIEFEKVGEMLKRKNDAIRRKRMSCATKRNVIL